MEQKSTRTALRLLKNTIYPTYQLYATMANKSTSPEDGLKIAALTVIEWLKERLGDDIPTVLREIPSHEDYKSCEKSCLESFHINEGYVIDVVSLPDMGMWTLQITEPHLGSDPGNPNQRVSAVPGRILETNMAFKISGKVLGCGFSLVVSDPEGTPEKSEVYRFSVVKRLADNPDFGLKHITILDHELSRIETQKNIDDFVALTRNSENQLPFVVFTQIIHQQDTPDIESLLQEINPLGTTKMTGLIDIPLPVKQQMPEDPEYDMKKFASSGLGYCRTYYLNGKVQEQFMKKTGIKISSGDVIVIDPCAFGSSVKKYGYRKDKKGRDETVKKLENYVHCFAREKQFSFGTISFLSAARNELIRSSKEILSESVATSEKEKQDFEERITAWQAELGKKDSEIYTLKKKLQEKEANLYDAKNNIGRQEELLKSDNDKLKDELAKKDVLIAYYKRKMTYPKSLDKIIDWANDNFKDRIFFHERAIRLMKNADADRFDSQMICDAIDHLATDYWEFVFGSLSLSDLQLKCSYKYGRPFEISPVSDNAIRSTPLEYKIKYFVGKDGKRHESALNLHLKVGNKSDNLMRIYFLLDKEKQIIVIGSLPAHLTNWQLKG